MPSTMTPCETDHTTPEPVTVRGSDGRAVAALSAREAAGYLGISETTLYALTRAGAVPHVRVGKAIRYRVRDLERYLEAQTTSEWTGVDGRGHRPSAPAA